MSTYRFAPPLAWAALILALTSTPNPERFVSAPVAGADKLVHLCLYAVLAFLTARAMEPARTARARLVVVAIVSAFGALDEWHQQFVPGRSWDSADWIADSAGAAIGVLILLTARRRREPAT